MQLKNSTFLATTVCIAGAAFLFGYFFYHKKDTPSPVEPETASNEQLPGPSFSQYKPTLPDTSSSAADIAFSKTAVRQNDQSAESDSDNSPSYETAEQPLSNQCTDSTCAERVLAFLADPANDEAAKVAMARTWPKPENKEETLSLLRLLQEAHAAQQHDLKDRLLQMLAGADSSESAELLISVLNGEQPDFSLQDLPEDLSYAIKKAVRLNPDENTGKRLAEEFGYQRSDETLAAIQDVKHPDMVYQLALEADQRGDTEQVRQLVQSLQNYADPRTLDVIMRLGDERILTEEDAAAVAYDWADAHAQTFDQERCETYLSEPVISPAQRAVAAAALSAASDPTQAMAALQKASANEANQGLRLSYEMAIDRISRRAGISTDNGE